MQIAGYDYAEGDLYFFAAQANPAHRASLIALFPLVHRLRGCIGVHWSRITPLRGCGVHGERATDHPVAGLVRRGEAVWLYVHENVPGISADRLSPWPLFKQMDFVSQRAGLVRYSLPVATLRRWTRFSLRDLPPGGAARQQARARPPK